MPPYEPQMLDVGEPGLVKTCLVGFGVSLVFSHSNHGVGIYSVSWCMGSIAYLADFIFKGTNHNLEFTCIYVNSGLLNSKSILKTMGLLKFE